MALGRKEAHQAGLPSLNRSREERRRTFTVGKTKMPAVPLHFWLWTAIAVGTFAIIYWRISQGQLASARSRILAKQRAMTVALGPKIFPFRDRVEGWVRELAAPGVGNFVAPNTDVEQLRVGPAVYLRLRVSATKDARSIRKAAASSLRDGFTSCLFITQQKQDPTVGAACRTGSDCPSGELCNEFNVCVQPVQPYNMRLVYRTLRVLSSDWSDELQQAPSELALNAYDRDLDGVAKRDVPVTVELLQRARYAAIVLDEDPAGGLPAELADAGESAEERLQRVPHFARIGVWDLQTGNALVRWRAEANAEVAQMGPKAVTDPMNLAAQQRQVNNCSLALQVREALKKSE